MRVIVCATPANEPHVHREGCRNVALGLADGHYVTAYVMGTAYTPLEAARWFWADSIDRGDMTQGQALVATTFMPCIEGREIAGELAA